MAHPSWGNYPQLLSEINLRKNAKLLFNRKPVHVLELACGTNKKLDWICKICQNEWIATGNSRTTMGAGCPACAGKAVHSDGRNSMAETHPRLAAEYQGDASKILAGTHKKLHWKCSTCDNEWTSSGKVRSQLGGDCPACSNQAIHSDGRNSMEATHPDLAKEYLGDATKIIAGTSRILEWQCFECSHIWRVSGHKRKSDNTGCPACANRAIHNDGRNSMETTHPDLAKEYLGDPAKITAGTNEVLRWKCKICQYVWGATGVNRSKNGSGCPVCANQVVHPDGRNSLRSTHPRLAEELIGNPDSLVAGTSTKLDWKCSVCDHTWKATGNARRAGSGCPACSNNVLHIDGRNSMKNTHPELAKELIGDPNTLLAGTSKKLDWQCSICDFTWNTSGSNRVRGSGCPACASSGYDPSKIGHFYILHYSDDKTDWLKCGISNYPTNRILSLKGDASKFNIEIVELDLHKFDDGAIPRNCERELLDMAEIRYESGYDIQGKTEFFKFEALETIRKFIEKW